MGYNATDSTAPPCKRFSLDAHQVALSELSPRLLAGAFFFFVVASLKHTPPASRRTRARRNSFTHKKMRTYAPPACLGRALGSCLWAFPQHNKRDGVCRPDSILCQFLLAAKAEQQVIRLTAKASCIGAFPLLCCRPQAAEPAREGTLSHTRK